MYSICLFLNYDAQLYLYYSLAGRALFSVFVHIEKIHIHPHIYTGRSKRNKMRTSSRIESWISLYFCTRMSKVILLLSCRTCRLSGEAECCFHNDTEERFRQGGKRERVINFYSPTVSPVGKSNLQTILKQSAERFRSASTP